MASCETCGVIVRPHHKGETPRFCSWHCRYGTPESRFWGSVRRGGKDECWEWTGSTRTGYGAIYVNGSTISAHRYSYELANGPIPQSDGYHGTCVLHICDNRKCVNPAHLFLGSAADNNADKASKGRARSRAQKGERNGQSKLTADIVRQIRAADGPQRSIAKRFGVAQATVGRIRLKQHWRHIA